MIEKLIKWSADNYSHLPWRKNRSSYNTLVSEIMLQQTTVGTVLNHFDDFIKKYPTVRDLADATQEEILIQWKGLGYYRRARNLHKAAIQIVEKHHGQIPLDYKQLIAINGIGPYTANAILSIGNDIPGVCIDANLERVLSRIYGIEKTKGPSLQKEIYNLFEQGAIAKELHIVGARAYNEALMDLGRSICKARSASCEICPLSSKCEAGKLPNPLALPLENLNKVREKFELTVLRIIYQTGGKLLVYKKSDDQWLSGQYEIPTFIMESDDDHLKQYPHITKKADHLMLLPEFKSSITKYKITNKIIHIDEYEINDLGIDLRNYQFISIDRLTNLTTASLKALKE